MEEKESFPLRFLYHTMPGRGILKHLVKPAFSRRIARLLSSELSRPYIGYYIKKHQIGMEEYEGEDYRCFNDFFMRRRRAERISIDREPTHLISPCDGLLSAWQVTRESRFRVKGSDYTLCDLLNNRMLANQYQNGICLVFRLMPRHYHRYCYIDDGHKGDNYPIPGVLHCVRPIACECYPVYTQNSRVYTVMDTDHFGPVVQIEVGALLVGRICNEQERGRIVRGEEKGHFEFGGSTIILLLKKDTAQIDGDVLARTVRGQETPVRMGQCIGHAGGRQ